MIVPPEKLAEYVGKNTRRLEGIVSDYALTKLNQYDEQVRALGGFDKYKSFGTLNIIDYIFLEHHMGGRSITNLSEDMDINVKSLCSIFRLFDLPIDVNERAIPEETHQRVSPKKKKDKKTKVKDEDPLYQAHPEFERYKPNESNFKDLAKRLVQYLEVYDVKGMVREDDKLVILFAATGIGKDNRSAVENAVISNLERGLEIACAKPTDSVQNSEWLVCQDAGHFKVSYTGRRATISAKDRSKEFLEFYGFMLRNFLPHQ